MKAKIWTVCQWRAHIFLGSLVAVAMQAGLMISTVIFEIPVSLFETPTAHVLVTLAIMTLVALWRMAAGWLFQEAITRGEVRQAGLPYAEWQISSASTLSFVFILYCSLAGLAYVDIPEE